MLEGYPPDENFLRRAARDALSGVGDASLGEYEEWSGFAFHLRRRLSHKEQKITGEVVDVRGTAEGTKRRAKVERFAPAWMRDWYE